VADGNWLEIWQPLHSTIRLGKVLYFSIDAELRTPTLNMKRCAKIPASGNKWTRPTPKGTARASIQIT
jgi:hypothetical protein